MKQSDLGKSLDPMPQSSVADGVELAGSAGHLGQAVY
jgi:hypothetical protein